MTQKKGSSIVDVLVAIYINIPALNVIITTLAPSLSGLTMAILYISITTLLLLCQIQVSYRTFFVFNGLELLFVSLFLLFVFCVSASQGYSSLSIIEFIVYVIIPMLFISKLDIHYEVVLKYCPIISVFGIFIGGRIFITTYNSISMGLSYAFLPSIIFSLVYLFLDRKQKIITICACANMFYLLELVLHGSRGPMVSVLICILFMLLLEKKHDRLKISWWKAVFLLVLGLLFIIYFWSIIQLLSTTFSSIGINISFLDKMQLLKNINDIDNGRNIIHQTAWQLIMKRPLFGYGLSTFDFYTSMEYPHNFLIQMIFDIGYVGMIIVMMPVILGAYKVIKNLGSDFAFIMAIACISIPGALFSGDLWKNAILWLTFAILIKNSKRRSYESAVSNI